MDIYAFIETGIEAFESGRRMPLNGWVTHPEFTEIYVRVTTRIIDGERRSPVIDLANILAKRPRNGAFRRLIAELHHFKFPKAWIYVENAYNPGFCSALKNKLGFTEANGACPPSFYMPPPGYGQ